MGGVVDGTAINAANTNAAFIEKNAADVMPFDLTMGVGLIFTQVTTRATPSVGFNRMYYKADGFLYSLDSTGTETKVLFSGAIVNADIASGAQIANSKLANVATATFKGRTTAGTGSPEDLTATQATALLNPFVGDSGSGGTKGLVPAPGAGDAAAGKFLKADGTFAVPLTGSATFYIPTSQTLTASSGTYGLSYYFIVSSASATIGATYTNNAQTFTVKNTISGATLLLCTSTGTPASSGTLTKSTGTGDATITFSAFKAPIYLLVTMVAPGAGGAGSATSGAGGAGTNGGNTTFGTSLLTCNGGIGGVTGSPGPVGGTATISSPAYGGLAIQGGGGGAGPGGTGMASGIGGSSIFGGAGPSANGANTGSSGNNGGGGSGGSVSAGNTGAGGSAGGGIKDAIIPNPSATYTFTNGSAGTGGTAGTGGSAGGTGNTTSILVVEKYQ